MKQLKDHVIVYCLKPNNAFDMKSQIIELPLDDTESVDHVFKTLTVCGHDHVFSRMLVQHFGNVPGSVNAITPDWLDLSKPGVYQYGHAYPDGLPSSYEAGRSPLDVLVAFVRQYLLGTDDALVLSEIWGWNRRDMDSLPWKPARILTIGDENVYGVLSSSDSNADSETIEASISPRGHWQTSACSNYKGVLPDELEDRSTLATIVHATKHLFVPAFDGNGYLIWTPKKNGRN